MCWLRSCTVWTISMHDTSLRTAQNVIYNVVCQKDSLMSHSVSGYPGITPHRGEESACRRVQQTSLSIHWRVSNRESRLIVPIIALSIARPATPGSPKVSKAVKLVIQGRHCSTKATRMYTINSKNNIHAPAEQHVPMPPPLVVTTRSLHLVCLYLLPIR